MTQQDAEARPPAAQDALDLKGNVDRFSTLVAKSMELAEVGMNLGLGIISSLGSAAQQKIVQKLAETSEGGMAQGRPAAPPPPPAQAPAQPDYGITNRLPLTPGGAVSISFSVNNEAASGAKQVSLLVEGFAGDHTGRSLPATILDVAPAARSIAPMDFEKFVLTGAIPADAAPDIYRGYVVVVSDTVIRIPVWLVVDAAA